MTNVEITVEAKDRGGSEITVEGTISNGESRQYSGTLRVHIVEMNSRFIDYEGNNYPNALLGYALVEDVNIPSSGQHEFSASWIGAENEDLGGNDFGDIQRDNIVVYAVVFNSRMSIESYPPARPYTAHYADAAAEAFPVEIGNAPTVEITAPNDGDTVSGTVEITAEVSSVEDIDLVEIKIGQSSWEEMELFGGEYVHEWDTTLDRNGPHRISVRAFDVMDQSGIANIEVTVENEDVPTPPEISSLTHTPIIPKEGETITINLELTIFDTTIVSAEAVICLDGVCLPPKDMFEHAVDTFSLEIGPYEAGQLVAYNVVVEDSEGNIVESSENEFTIQSAVVPPDDDDTAPDDDVVSDDDDGTGDVQSAGDQTTVVIAVVVILIIVVLIIAIFITLSRRGKKEREIEPLHIERSTQVYARESQDEDLEIETGVLVK